MEKSMYHYKAIITDIYDADTVTADIDLGCGVWIKGEKLRLFGINAPEMRGPEKKQGTISRDWLREEIWETDVSNERIYDNPVIIKTIKDKTGKYGRLLAVIYMQDSAGQWINLNELMVELGYAVKKDY